MYLPLKGSSAKIFSVFSYGKLLKKNVSRKPFLYFHLQNSFFFVLANHIRSYVKFNKYVPTYIPYRIIPNSSTRIQVRNRVEFFNELLTCSIESPQLSCVHATTVDYHNIVQYPTYYESIFFHPEMRKTPTNSPSPSLKTIERKKKEKDSGQ